MTDGKIIIRWGLFLVGVYLVIAGIVAYSEMGTVSKWSKLLPMGSSVVSMGYLEITLYVGLGISMILGSYSKTLRS